MGDKSKALDSLLEKTVEYVKASFDLGTLKVLHKGVEIVSAIIPFAVVLFMMMFFLFFLNIGLAIWLGSVLGNVYSGFLAVSLFYALTAAIIHLFMRKRIKRASSDFIIKQLFK